MLRGRVISEQLRSQTVPYVCSDAATLGKIIHLSEPPFSSSTGWQKQDNRIYILGWSEDDKVLRWRLSLLALKNSKETGVAVMNEGNVEGDEVGEGVLNFFRDCRGTRTWFVASSDAPFCSVVCASGQCWSTWSECLNGVWNSLCTSGARPDVAYLGTQNAFSFCVNMINTGVPPRGGNMQLSRPESVDSSFWTALHYLLSCLFVIILWGEILLGNLER